MVCGMTRVMAVAFAPFGQLHYLDPGERLYAAGDWVLVPTDSGPEVARCVWAPEDVDADGFTDLPVCPGPASEADLERDRRHRAERAQIDLVARELIGRHRLPMKVVGVDLVEHGQIDRLVAIYFTAPGRVDFRQLLGDLARAIQARIDLRQVASRDAARLIGGVGTCGRSLCCATFLDRLEPISLRAARTQDLAPNPLQIAGACGRLMCCLAYQQQLYLDFDRRAPAIGDRVLSSAGVGAVVARSVPDESVTVRTEAGDLLRCPLAKVCPAPQVRLKRRKPSP